MRPQPLLLSLMLKVKQIVLEAKFWSNRWVVVVIGDKRGFIGQSSPQGQTAGKSGLPLLMFGQQLLHLGENHSRIFILLSPIQSSKVPE